MSATPTTADAAPTDQQLTPAAATDTAQLSVDGSDGRSGALYVHPDGSQARLHEHDTLYARRVVNERQGERFVEYRRRKVARFVDVGGTWYVEWADDYDLGRQRTPLREVLATIATGEPVDGVTDATYRQTSPDGFDVHDASGTWRTWEAVRQWERTPDVDLTFEQISGRGSRNTVNAFLEGESAPVDHALGGVSKWKAAFVARDAAGEIVSALVTHFYHPSQNGRALCITRLANRAGAPENTSSWMLANVRQWARREGYETLATYAGVGANAGVCYSAAGMRPAGEPERVTGATWTDSDDSDNSDGSDDVGAWTRQKYVADLGN